MIDVIKLRFLFLGVAYLVTMVALAQTKTGFSVDALVGVNVNKLHAQPTTESVIYPEAKWHADWRVGVDVHYTFETPVVISSGLTFAQKTFSLKGDVYGRSIGEGHFENLSYLQVPVTVGYNVSIGSWELRPWVGLIVNYGLGGDATYMRSYVHPTPSGDEAVVVKRPAFLSAMSRPYTNNLERFDFACNVGVHVQYKRYGLKVGYEHGITSLHTEYTNPYSRGIVVALTHRLF